MGHQTIARLSGHGCVTFEDGVSAGVRYDLHIWQTIRNGVEGLKTIDGILTFDDGFDFMRVRDYFDLELDDGNRLTAFISRFDGEHCTIAVKDAGTFKTGK